MTDHRQNQQQHTDDAVLGVVRMLGDPDITEIMQVTSLDYTTVERSLRRLEGLTLIETVQGSPPHAPRYRSVDKKR